jgi:hypothetical protein
MGGASFEPEAYAEVAQAVVESREVEEVPVEKGDGEVVDTQEVK